MNKGKQIVFILAAVFLLAALVGYLALRKHHRWNTIDRIEESQRKHPNTEAEPGRRVGKKRPYASDSPWNLRIGRDPVYEPDGDIYVDRLNGKFGANPNMYATPIYYVSESTPVQSVTVTGWYSRVKKNGEKLEKKRRTTVEIPIPTDANPARGRDAQILLWDPETGDEWGFWKATRSSDGRWVAKNGYHYNTNWDGVPPEGFISRGAGIPYLAGLLRPWELKEGRIEHALGFAVNYPSKFFVYPATKSDGSRVPPALPEGARLQLDPQLDRKDFARWGLSRGGRIIAKALQEYGMIVTDGSDHPKLQLEYQGTANWGDLLNKDIVSKIPFSAFKLLRLDTPEQPPPPKDVQAEVIKEHIRLQWAGSKTATRYRVKREAADTGSYQLVGERIRQTSFLDTNVEKNEVYHYQINAVNYNGISEPASIKITHTPK